MARKLLHTSNVYQNWGPVAQRKGWTYWNLPLKDHVLLISWKFWTIFPSSFGIRAIAPPHARPQGTSLRSRPGWFGVPREGPSHPPAAPSSAAVHVSGMLIPPRHGWVMSGENDVNMWTIVNNYFCFLPIGGHQWWFAVHHKVLWSQIFGLHRRI